MLSVEIRINGVVCAVLNACNRGLVSTEGVCRYEYQGVSFPLNSEGPPTRMHGFLEHTRSDGAEVLVARLCEAMTKGKRTKGKRRGTPERK